jgi:monoamine oxidase
MIRRGVFSPDLNPLIQREAAARASRPRVAPLTDAVKAAAAAAKPFHVVIVGAGLAGLCAAYELEHLGHTAVILEADGEHVGGRVRTLRFGKLYGDEGLGQLYGEAGAMRIPKNHAITRHYVSLFKLPLRKFVQVNDNAYYFIRGQRVRLNQEELIKRLFCLTPCERNLTTGDMWRLGMVRVLEGLIRQELDDLDSDVLDTAAVRALDQRTLQQMLEVAGLSEEAIDFLTSTWGLETSLQTAATELLREELNAIWTPDFDEIVGGTDLLPRAFADNLRTKPRHGCEVVRLEQDGATGKAAAVYREYGSSSLKREEGDFLLCTLPLPVLSRLEVSPPFSGPKHQAIRQVNYDSSTKVLAIAKRRFWEEEEDRIFGGGTATDLPTGFTYYPSDNAEAKDPEVTAARSVFLASYTWGQPARRLAALPARDVKDFVVRNLSNFHPQLEKSDLIEKAVMWSWDNFKWSSGAFAWFQPGQHTALHKDLIAPEGRIFLAGEHTSLDHTWMQGALESAQRAVKDMIAVATAP